MVKVIKHKILNIIGIDGSGKTTLAKDLTEAISGEGIDCQYIYCQFFAKLLFPFKFIAKHSVMKKTDEYADYSNYISMSIETICRLFFYFSPLQPA